MIKIIPKFTKAIEKIAAKNFALYKAISVYYKEMVKEEVSLANIKSSDKILCIGGGPCPFSGILLHEYTGANVTVIDNDPSCVRTAKYLIKNLGYENSIVVLHSDGSDICLKDYDVIHMAVQVSPMEQVFYQLKQKCNLGAKILVRLPKKTLSNFYDINDNNFITKHNGKVMHNWRNVGSTALYVNCGN